MQRIKVFIDTSVLIAGVASVTGASAAVLDLCESETVQMVVSRQVLVEADRNFSAKLPNLVSQYRQFIKDLAPLVTADLILPLYHRSKNPPSDSSSSKAKI